MQKRWYISTLIITLTVLAAVFQHQISVPNQEIVLQFTDSEISSDDAQTTIAIVKKQLQDLGVDNIHVKKQNGGTLKIVYYSDADIESIKEILSNEKKIELEYALPNKDENPLNFPSDKNSVSYNLDVYEIQNANDAQWGIDGIHVLQLKQEGDRFFNPNVYASIIELDTRDNAVKVACKVQAHIAITIDNTSYNIPEVRAGPSC